MTISRHVARPLLASIFVVGGVDTLRNAGAKAPAAEDVATPVAARLPGLGDMDTEQLVRATAGVQVGAGALLAIGRVPRLAAVALAATLVPATAAGHRFWEHDAPQRADHREHFFKNVSLLGGLLLAALDTEGRPGVLWRTRHATEHAGAAVRRTRREAKLAAKASRPVRLLAA
ncbi:MAG: hypothetical protein AVDCRST_MAG20-1770 [uncultured Acidimicrobiales bacterium]|uniref:DoxX family protein n=1 Tax=uncultured Acidimicrobiales bacterium TaxID=310071 RepID=A0A6J4I6N6_9ACTN|nr:MAG: hypothetical protein AVDCRST_MAG20-1770 [uncultured Acidimicrobiales bacterium]